MIHYILSIMTLFIETVYSFSKCDWILMDGIIRTWLTSIHCIWCDPLVWGKGKALCNLARYVQQMDSAQSGFPSLMSASDPSRSRKLSRYFGGDTRQNLEERPNLGTLPSKKRRQIHSMIMLDVGLITTVSPHLLMNRQRWPPGVIYRVVCDRCVRARHKMLNF